VLLRSALKWIKRIVLVRMDLQIEVEYNEEMKRIVFGTKSE